VRHAGFFSFFAFLQPRNRSKWRVQFCESWSTDRADRQKHKIIFPNIFHISKEFKKVNAAAILKCGCWWERMMRIFFIWPKHYEIVAKLLWLCSLFFAHWLLKTHFWLVERVLILWKGLLALRVIVLAVLAIPMVWKTIFWKFYHKSCIWHDIIFSKPKTQSQLWNARNHYYNLWYLDLL